MIKILFICHGNICRSTMAEAVLKYLLEREGLSEEVVVESAGTSATARASLLLREFKNNKMTERKEYVTMRLEKNGDCKTQAVCAPAILTCEG